MSRDDGAAACLGLIGAGCIVASIVWLMAAFPVVFGVIVAAGVPGLIIAGWVIESRDRHVPRPATSPPGPRPPGVHWSRMSGWRWFGVFVVLALLGPWLVPWAVDSPDLVLSALGFALVLFFGIWASRRPYEWAKAEESGIQFLEPAGPPPPADARCLICRHALAGDIVTCARCRTPHHRECFRFVGTCSIYACGSRERRRAA